MIEKIQNIQTGEVIERELTPEEIAEAENRHAEAEAQRLARAERQAKLDSAKAKLAALGLDEAEVNAILGL